MLRNPLCHGAEGRAEEEAEKVVQVQLPMHGMCGQCSIAQRNDDVDDFPNGVRATEDSQRVQTANPG